MATSGDGRVADTGNHHVITVWDAATFQPRATIQEAGENLGGIALAPDGSIAAAARSQHVTLGRGHGP